MFDFKWIIEVFFAPLAVMLVGEVLKWLVHNIRKIKKTFCVCHVV